MVQVAKITFFFGQEDLSLGSMHTFRPYVLTYTHPCAQQHHGFITILFTVDVCSKLHL